jgi:hypothetical protein
MNEAVSLVDALAVPDVSISDLSDRELLEEIATNQRKILAIVGGMIQAASKNPMIAMMLGGM